MTGALGALLIVSVYASAGQRRYGLCEVLENLDTLHGQIILFHGVDDRSSWAEFSVPRCSHALVIAGYQFDNVIVMRHPDSLYVKKEAGNLVDFPPDTAGAEHLDKVLRAGRRDSKFEITVEGMIITRVPLSSLVKRRDPPEPNGFGHLGMAPAMIVVKRVVGVKAVD